MADATTSDRIGGYADAVLAVARAEGAQAEVEDELARFAEALRSSDELQSTLADSVIDVERRLQITEDLLAGQALPATAALVSLVVGSGRGGELVEIIDAAIDRAAAGRNRRVARVRSAVELTGEQRSRLTEAIKASSGLEVEIQAIVDPSVVGGVVTEIGDDVIDGSVRSRLQQMRSGLG
ncbi:MAG: ATP synthase F1 subunit delta [Acidimicrobiaceae bacterium]|nr:ATP synthase F1 subunit delta [Acidimicrobiaceae bacterium]MYE75445.1 ATP synthase F1 subunit delta [Acidimicrobiaceae bacterium]MYE96044.1 ATP synthase F1 subunit delta [Acidimicrobiaceae bacterium]MYH42917.1 ATP synthase F1 subunit delta [Acidimicrobiaceae bacterium]MYI55013.1 ATP synthase F1 subunit delta [Acidimicrobiaceae bacterium]